MQTEQIITILYKLLAGGHLSAGEQASLDAWIAENPEKRRLMIEGLCDPNRLAEDYRLRSMIDTSRPHEDMERRLGISSGNEQFRKTPLSNPMWRRFMGAAACVAAIVGAFFLYRNWNHTDSSPKMIAVSDLRQPLRIENLGPGTSRATVTTQKGDTIRLDGQPESSALSTKTTEGPLQIDVPRGGEFVVTLEDSTKVWLNSETRLIYPAHFAANTRKVEIEGEAYFEVAHNPEVPFIVESFGQRVKVYGTEFNIRAYPEEGKVYTSLSSGKVSLAPISGGGEVFLSPGKQAVFDKETSKAQIRNIDLERVTGWRHGRFVFEEQSLRQIMQDLSRWYDFTYEFADPEAAETIFMGSIPRYSNFKTAIAILEKSGGLTFKVKDDVIVISSKH